MNKAKPFTSNLTHLFPPFQHLPSERLRLSAKGGHLVCPHYAERRSLSDSICWKGGNKWVKFEVNGFALFIFILSCRGALAVLCQFKTLPLSCDYLNVHVQRLHVIICDYVIITCDYLHVIMYMWLCTKCMWLFARTCDYLNMYWSG